MSQPSRTTREFTGVRVDVSTPLSFDEVLKRLRDLVGHASAPDLSAFAKQTVSQSDFEREVVELVGESGFVVFSEIDHGGWIEVFGLHRKALRWILGNPLIAITMLRQDIAAGLFVPVELLLVDNTESGGALLIYVRPSSLIAMNGDPELLAAAKALDAKFEALISRVTSVE